MFGVRIGHVKDVFGASRWKHVFGRPRDTWGIYTRGAGKLYKAHYQLYRSQILQENLRWEALAEINTMHSFAPFSELNLLFENR